MNHPIRNFRVVLRTLALHFLPESLRASFCKRLTEKDFIRCCTLDAMFARKKTILGEYGDGIRILSHLSIQPGEVVVSDKEIPVQCDSRLELLKSLVIAARVKIGHTQNRIVDPREWIEFQSLLRFGNGLIELA